MGIECKICFKEFKAITNTHLHNKHSLTSVEYINRFAGACLVSKDTNLKRSNTLKMGYCTGRIVRYERTEEIKVKISKKLIGQQQSEATREKRVKALTGQRRSIIQKQRISVGIKKAYNVRPAYRKNASLRMIGSKNPC